MDKVVYILGAGFSAPLGLPVMGNFLVKSKDMFADKPAEHKSFQKVFKTIDQMSECKNYFKADLFNIEEILSILEMKEGLRNGGAARSFIDYVSDVIKSCTPPMPPPPQLSAVVPGWFHSILTGDWRPYGAFVASLFNLCFESTNDSFKFTEAPKRHPPRSAAASRCCDRLPRGAIGRRAARCY